MRGKIDRFVTWMRRHRNLIALSAGGVILIRLWPLLAVETGWNLRGAIVHQHPESSFLPPPVAPVEIRSGRAHPGFHAPRLAAELIFLPTAVRHSHAFKRDDPALPPASALALAILLSDPSTYSQWLGESGCGGFHGDWYLRWADGHEAIICEGCHEILLYHENRFIRCNFSWEAYKQKKIEAIVRPAFQE